MLATVTKLPIKLLVASILSISSQAFNILVFLHLVKRSCFFPLIQTSTISSSDTSVVESVVEQTNLPKLRKPFPLQFMHRRPSLPLRRDSDIERDGGSAALGSQRNLQEDS